MQVVDREPDAWPVEHQAWAVLESESDYEDVQNKERQRDQAEDTNDQHFEKASDQAPETTVEDGKLAAADKVDSQGELRLAWSSK